MQRAIDIYHNMFNKLKQIKMKLNSIDMKKINMDKLGNSLEKKLDNFFDTQIKIFYKVIDKIFSYSYRETQSGIYALFSSPDDICNAARHIHKTGHTNFDCFTPFPVHHLERYMGLKPSYLTYVAFWGGLTGFALAVLLQTVAHEQILPSIFPYFDAFPNLRSYPLNIGGKPTFSWPPMVPIAFELTVLFSGHATVFMLILLAKLFKPSRKVLHPSITNDKFCLWIPEDSKNYNEDYIFTTMKELDAIFIAKQISDKEKQTILYEKNQEESSNSQENSSSQETQETSI